MKRRNKTFNDDDDDSGREEYISREELARLQQHIAEAQHVAMARDELWGELKQQTFRNLVFGCLVLFLTIVQALVVWEGHIYLTNPLPLRDHPHADRTLVKVVDSHPQTHALRWVVILEGVLMILWLLRRFLLRSDTATSAGRLQGLLFLTGSSAVLHVGALGVRFYTLVLVHFLWLGTVNALLDVLWFALTASSFFTLLRLNHVREHAQELHNTNPTRNQYAFE